VTNPLVINEYIQEEVAAGRMIGPLPRSILGGVHCSPVGLVPKGRESSRWRMIVDLSYPPGHRVNDGIDRHLCSLKYATLDNATKFITRLGHNTLLLKIDLRSAYRIVPVHPHDRHLLGMCWDGQVFIDQALPFSLRSAPKLFTAVADAVGWAPLDAGLPLQLHYLDDFLFFFPPGTPAPQAVLTHIQDILDTLGVPVAVNKIEGPATTITFLGMTVDTVRSELRFPQHKLKYIRGLVSGWRVRRSGTYHEFQSLIGHLAHAATVIR